MASEGPRKTTSPFKLFKSFAEGKNALNKSFDDSSSAGNSDAVSKADITSSLNALQIGIKEGTIPNPSALGYEYRPLDQSSRQIRALKLNERCDPSSSALLQFDVATISLPRRNAKFARLKRKFEEFFAISYAWGDNSQPTQIIMDGRKTNVPDSAEEALRGVLNVMHKAGLKRDSYIWIDAICINQRDLAEKSHQVSMMGDLYSAARGVLIWLGYDKGMVQRNLGSLRKSELKSDISVLEGILTELLQCKWFTRLWVVQEVVLARAAYMFRGQVCLSWKTFSTAVRTLKDRSRFAAGMDSYNSLLITSVICDLAISRCRPTSQLLGLSIQLNASMPEDRVFAILGLRDEESSPIASHYGTSLRDVYSDATYLTMSDEKSLELLWHAAMASRKSIDTSITEWPSWVPKFDELSASRNVQMAALLGGDFHADGRSGCAPQRLREVCGIRVSGVVVGRLSGTFELKEPDELEHYSDPELASKTVEVAKYFASLWSPEVLEGLDFKWSKGTLLAIQEALPHWSHPPLTLDQLASLLLLTQEFISPEANAELKQVLDQPSIDSSKAESWDFISDLHYFAGDYTLLRLEDGRFGICSLGAEKGDYICLLFGQNAPLILRRQGRYWHIRGIVKVAGIMKGEYIQQLKQENRLEEDTQMFDII